MPAPRLAEPTSTISAVLTLRQIVWLTEEADRRGISRTSVMREVLDRGIDATPKDDDAKEQEAA